MTSTAAKDAPAVAPRRPVVDEGASDPWVVHGTKGQYSDRQEWIVGYGTEDGCKAWVEAIGALIRETMPRDKYSDEFDAWELAMQAHDPMFGTYSGDEPLYTAYAVEPLTPTPNSLSAEGADSTTGAAGDAAASSLPDASSTPAPASEEGE